MQLAKAESGLQTFRDSLDNRYPEVQIQRAAHKVSLLETAKFLPADTALLEYVTLYSQTGKDILDRAVLFVVAARWSAPAEIRGGGSYLWSP